ncbi:MAG: leucine-rich repeat protein [Oscillospiraceae bacterium]|nr:leucine-rich repeat protein [Oscillospiraceae bacterium]
MNDILIRQAFAGIGPPPGAEDRIRQRLETVLGEPLRARSVTVRPRVNPLPKLLAAAAMLTVVVGGTALILWPLLRPIFLPDGPELLTEIEEPADGTPAPTEEAEPVEEAPEEPEPSEPTEDPAYVLGPIVDEGTVTLEDGRSLTWAVDQKGLLRIRGEGDMADFCGNYHWQTNWQDQLPWQGYLASVQTVVVEPGLTTIAPRAFSDFRSLTDLLLPDSLETIGDNAFYECTELEEVSIPEGVLAIGDRAFFDCKSLKSITIPESVISIGTKAFSHCPLSSVELPGSVAGNWEYAFEYCQSLYSVRIGEGVQTIGDYAFYLCEDMTVIVIPASVTEIGTGAFVGCGNLVEVYFAGSEEQWQQIVIGSGNENLRNVEIYYETIPGSLTAEDLSAYQLGTVVDEGTAAAENGNTLSWTLDRKGLLLIRGEGDMEDFYPFVILKRYDPSAGRLVEESKPAYPWTNHLSSIRAVLIEPGLSSIGDNAFSNAGTLIRVQIPETVTRIGSAAFSNCGLESVTIPEGLETIGEYAFSNCFSMRSISISDTVTSIGEWAFYRAGLESVTIPGSVEVIGDNAFNNCLSLKSVTIQDGVREIRTNAFFYCESLAEISIPGSVTKIGHGVFYWCRSLESVVIPEGVTEIEDECFSTCTALKNVWLPASLSKVSYSQFENCVSLSDIYYAGSEEQWDQIMEAFAKGLLDYVTIHFNSEP